VDNLELALKTRNKKIIIASFLFCIALFPYISIFWQDYFPLVNVKINWLLYPILISGIIMVVLIREKAPSVFYLLLLFTLFYLLLIALKGEEFETLFRFSTAVLPFSFIDFFYDEKISAKNMRLFWIVYCLCFSVPLYYAYLQYVGKMPYYDFDVQNGVYGGRISGGYNKPMNFVAYLFPIFVGGFYFLLIKRKRIIGYGIILGICALLIVIGHRTSLISFLVIIASSFFQRSTIKLIYFYYKNFINFLAGISIFIGFYFFYYAFGIKEGLRGRIAMWEAHAENFFNDDFLSIIFGNQKILLDSKYSSEPLIGPLALEEAHNNTFRTIIFFGVFGYFLYCLFIRWLVLKVYRSTEDQHILFIRFSCFTFLILYMITNEPIYYGSILYPILVCILPIYPQRNEMKV